MTGNGVGFIGAVCFGLLHRRFALLMVLKFGGFLSLLVTSRTVLKRCQVGPLSTAWHKYPLRESCAHGCALQGTPACARHKELAVVTTALSGLDMVMLAHSPLRGRWIWLAAGVDATPPWPCLHVDKTSSLPFSAYP